MLVVVFNAIQSSVSRSFKELFKVVFSMLVVFQMIHFSLPTDILMRFRMSKTHWLHFGFGF